MFIKLIEAFEDYFGWMSVFLTLMVCSGGLGHLHSTETPQESSEGDHASGPV